MNWKHLVAICVIAALPSIALAAKPTKADVQKVVATISGDKAKLKIYCDAQKIYAQMGNLDPDKDKKKLDELGKQASALEEKLGPEYVNLVKAMDELTEAESKELEGEFESLTKMCGKA